MKKRYLRTVLLFLGIVGIAFYLLFPTEKVVKCIEKELINLYLYGDSANEVAFTEMEPFAFKCRLLNENENCGIGFSFNENSNWNLMDSLVLNLQGSKNFKELIIQILTIDPDHTDIDHRSSMKPVLKEIHLDEDKKRYSIAMSHFYTPDYWFEQQNAKNTSNPKRFSAVAGLEIFSGWKNYSAQPLELKVESICLEGANNKPFVTLVVYLCILIAIAISARIRN
jgi:hypothetical protein